MEAGVEVILDEHRARRDAERRRTLVTTALVTALVGGLLGAAGALAGSRIAARNAARQRGEERRIEANGNAVQVVNAIVGDVGEYQVAVARRDDVVRAAVRSRLAVRRDQLRSARAQVQVVGSGRLNGRLQQVDTALGRVLVARDLDALKAARADLQTAATALAADARVAAG